MAMARPNGRVIFDNRIRGAKPMAKTVKLGSVTLTEPTTYTQHYETASWYTDYAVPAGTYDVYGYAEPTVDRGGGTRIPHYGVWYVVPKAVVTSSHFVNRLFHASSVEHDRNVGQVRQVNVPINLTDQRLALTDGVLEARPTSPYQNAWLA
jgi:hypothetical protein